MKRSLSLSLVFFFVALAGHALAAGNDVLVRVSPPDRDNRFKVLIENASNEPRRLTVVIELKIDDRWVENPHRIEDSRLAMQRPIHLLAPTAKKSFVWDTARDKTLDPELPAGVPSHQAHPVTARICVRLFVASGAMKTFVCSEPFAASL